MAKGTKRTEKLAGVIGRIPIIGSIGRLSRKKKTAGAAVLLAVLAGGGYLASGFLSGGAQALSYEEATVSRGTIEETISGTGTVEPIDQYDVAALVQGEVVSDTFEEGDTVEKGQTLYTIDSSDVENSLQKAQLSLEKSAMSYDQSLDSYTGLTVTSPTSGKVAELYVAKGDNVQDGAKIARLEDDSQMTARVPFAQADAAGLYEGQSATVTVENSFETLYGTITKVYGNQRALDGNVTVTDVDVTVNNPGALTAGTYVSAQAGGVECYESAQLESFGEQIVTAKASGMVSQIDVILGERISTGTVILRLTSNTAADNLKSSELSLRDAQLSYQNTQKQLDDYIITAPISGSVIEKTTKAGDKLDSSTNKEVMAVIADMSTMIFKISVDELDVAKMEEGQMVNITIDALEGQEFTGYVDNVSLNGASTNGVTTYPVTVVINDPVGVWPGMNATAEIVVDSAEDVLMIPVSAVSRGNQVLVPEDYEAEDQPAARNGGSAGAEARHTSGGGIDEIPPGNVSGSAAKTEKLAESAGKSAGKPDAGGSTGAELPEGYKYITVELGLNNDNYIEVKSGLKEGLTIMVPAVSAGSSASEQQGSEAQMGGMPGGGGRMSGGGAPGGGGMPGGGGGAPGGGGPGM